MKAIWPWWFARLYPPLLSHIGHPGLNKTRHFTLTSLPSAVDSSNSSPSLKEISVDLKVLEVFSTTLSPSIEIMVLGLAMPPILRRAMPTPVETMTCEQLSMPRQQKSHQKKVRFHIQPPLEKPISPLRHLDSWRGCKKLIKNPQWQPWKSQKNSQYKGHGNPFKCEPHDLIFALIEQLIDNLTRLGPIGRPLFSHYTPLLSLPAARSLNTAGSLTWKACLGMNV